MDSFNLYGSRKNGQVEVIKAATNQWIKGRLNLSMNATLSKETDGLLEV